MEEMNAIEALEAMKAMKREKDRYFCLFQKIVLG